MRENSPQLIDHFMKEHIPLKNEITRIHQLIVAFENGHMNNKWSEFALELQLPVEEFYQKFMEHIKREEKALFPILQNDKEDGCHYFSLDYEHKQIEQYLKQFLMAMSYKKDNLLDIEAQTIVSFLKLVHPAVLNHFKREEESIFPKALVGTQN